MSLEEKAMWWIAIFAMLAFVPASASAEEPAVHLKEAPGVDVVEGRCAACHSLDYVIINSPFLSNEKWDAAVTKMIKAFGAPSDERMYCRNAIET